MTPNTARLVALCCLGLSPLAMAQYKVIGPDGKVTYTDRPPTSSQAQVQVMSGHGAVGNGGAELAALPPALRQAVSRFPVTLYAAKSCPPCDIGREVLVQRGIPFNEKRVESSLDLEAYVQLSGGRSLPMLTVGSQQIKSGSLNEWNSYLDAAGYPKTSVLPAGYRRPLPTPLVGAANPVPPGAVPASAPGPALENRNAPTAPGTPAIRF